jgi:23S rRNA maturation mini-RNase III
MTPSRNVQVRDVPEPVHAELTRQAAAAGMSLNRFMLAELERIARRGRNAEVFRAAAARQGGRVTSEEIVEALRAGRDER